MYKCRECGGCFDKPKKCTDSFECWGHIEYEYYYVCPRCLGTDYDDIDKVELEERELEEEEYEEIMEETIR